MPRVAELPAGWRNFSTAAKIQHLLGMSVTRAAEILMWPLADLDELQLSLRTQVWRVVFVIGIRALLDGKLDREAARERNRAAILEGLDRKLAGADRPDGAASEAWPRSGKSGPRGEGLAIMRQLGNCARSSLASRRVMRYRILKIQT
jgi:hypothetical protein